MQDIADGSNPRFFAPNTIKLGINGRSLRSPALRNLDLLLEFLGFVHTLCEISQRSLESRRRLRPGRSHGSKTCATHKGTNNGGRAHGEAPGLPGRGCNIATLCVPRNILKVPSRDVEEPLGLVKSLGKRLAGGRDGGQRRSWKSRGSRRGGLGSRWISDNGYIRLGNVGRRCGEGIDYFAQTEAIETVGGTVVVGQSQFRQLFDFSIYDDSNPSATPLLEMKKKQERTSERHLLVFVANPNCG